ncbi:MAG: 50S ribosomal protein L9 [Chthoniobacterales bacterium]|nr:50S ribosomal protein L9 [Chthoniobacterales bacterium]
MAYSEVILTANVPNLGAEADVVRVRRGYARNYLLPRGLAIEATAATKRMVEHLKAKRAEREAKELAEAEELAMRIGKLTLRFALETGQEGKAFGSVTAKDIMEKLQAELKGLKGIELPKHAVALESPIKSSGEHEVEVKLHADVKAKLRVVIEVPKVSGKARGEEVVSEEKQEKKARKKKAKGE